jgi:cbb3-type cytochrome c oxidase subunit III
MKRIAQILIVLAIVSLFFVIERSGAQPVGSGTLSASSQQVTRDAATIYKSKCANCHGKDGSGKTLKAKFNGARNLADASWQKNVTDERIFNSISNGRGKKMPAFGNKLSETEIESLVAHVRRLKK